MTLSTDIKKIASSLSSSLIAIRRDLHQYPEIGFQEHRTGRKITEHLRSIRLDSIRSPVAKTGVIGILKGGRKGTKTIALRADMDALPIEEKNTIPYKSKHPGMMHACGHDGHVAIVLGAAMILKRLQSRIPGTVKFLFQPAEEGYNGAAAMVRSGALRNPKVDAVFGMHVSDRKPYGVLGISAGPVLAAADRFQVRVVGRGGHGAHPELCHDPIAAAIQIYHGFHSIEHNLKGNDARVISICSMHGGTAFNIIPDSVELLGTVRTLDTDVQTAIIRRMRQIIRNIQPMHGVRCEFRYMKGYSVTDNDARLSALAQSTAADLKIPVKDYGVNMGAEDFSVYQKYVPGTYIDLGILKRAAQPGLHNNRFDFDDRILAVGAAMLARCALFYLEKK